MCSFFAVAFASCANRSVKRLNIGSLAQAELKEKLEQIPLVGKNEASVTQELIQLGFRVSQPRQTSHLAFRAHPGSHLVDLAVQDHARFSIHNKESLFVSRTITVILLFANNVVSEFKIEETTVGL